MSEMLGQLVAFVRANEAQGQILGATGSFASELEHSGRDIADHEMAMPMVTGLALFSGWLDHSGGEDPDIVLEGDWRLLTHWETCRLRHGLFPWDPQTSDT